MKLSNKTYDVLKWIAMIVLPAVGTLYSTLAGIWGFPFGEQIVGTIVAVNTFLGIALGISNMNYKKESIFDIIEKYDEEEETEEVVEDAEEITE